MYNGEGLPKKNHFLTVHFLLQIQISVIIYMEGGVGWGDANKTPPSSCWSQ